MADRCFPNKLPKFIPEPAGGEAAAAASGGGSLAELLNLPYKALSERLSAVALELKNTVVRQTWGVSGESLKDCSLYTGSLGTAFLVFKAYEFTRSEGDLKLCLEIIRACDSASRDNRRVTFICGQAGINALGAVVAKHAGDEKLLDHFLARFRDIPLPVDLPNELLYGRAGFLWACAFLNRHIGKDTIHAAHMRAVVDDIIKMGRRLAKKGECPLMYEWHGKKYWGAAHGLAGIMHVLMHMELKPDEAADVKGTLRYMVKNRFPSGNYPSSEGSENDRLVHWCHGAPGVALSLVKAAEVFGSKEFLQAAVEAGEVVWNRGLLKRVGICHGNPEYLYRAKAFACFLHDRALNLISSQEMHGGDRPFSLFEGIGGMAYLFMDMIDPSKARFPGYEL